MPRRIERYAKRLGIYFWPSIEHDALVLDVWSSIPSSERPQDVFRRAVLVGLSEMARTGELPEKVLNRNRIGERLARRLPAAFMPPAALAPPQAPAYAPAPYAPAPYAPPAYEPGPAHVPAPMAFEEAEQAEPDIDAMLRMMGGSQPAASDDA
jgi:hypothetical protein